MTTQMKAALGGALLLAVASIASAGTDPHPGYVDLDSLASMASADIVVDVRLGGWLLGWARTAAAHSNDKHAAVLSSIDSIRVRVVRLDDQSFVEQAQALAQRLGTEGWEEFARVRETDHWLQVMVKGSHERIDGITIMAMESGDEAVFVNIAGRLDPADIARILQDKDLLHADIDIDLGAVRGKKTPARGRG